MWIVLRFLTVIGVYLWKFFWRRQGFEPAGEFQGVPRARKVITHKRRFVRAYHGLVYDGPLRFQFSAEGRMDSFFKGLGLAAEQVTGDRKFDDEVYITCDQSALGDLLRRDHEVRAAVLLLIEMRVKRVFSDGAHVWVETANEGHESEVLPLLHDLRQALVKTDFSQPEGRRDTFFWKALAVESLAWSLACYGLPGFIELAVHRNTLYPDPWAVFQAGLLCSLLVLVGLVALIVMLLRGSSRGHRIIVEGLLLLLVGVPLSTVQAVSDINIQADNAPPVLVESQVVDKRIKVRRRGRRRTSTHYYLDLRATQPRAVNGSIEVEASIHTAARQGGKVVITIHEGRLGFPWIESISPH